MTTLKDRRQQLLARLAELDERLHGIEVELDTERPRDWDDAAIECEGDEVLEHLGHAGQDEIRRIRAALQRLRTGEYGYCARCGDEISAQRLDVLPDTPLCRNCAAATG